MRPEHLARALTEEIDQTNLCVVLRAGASGLEALIVADEQGRWSIPGGHAKDSETLAQACVREVKEETGLDVEVHPLMWAMHAARKRNSNLFYAIANGDEPRPGGGDVTKVKWVPVADLGNLNGTDRLAILTAANRVHNVQGLIDEAVEAAELEGYAVANVSAPPLAESGIHLVIKGKARHVYEHKLAEWASNLSIPAVVIDGGLFESTTSALYRASRRRQLTPVLDCLLHTADALWHYESRVVPILAKGQIAIDARYPAFDKAYHLGRGTPSDVVEALYRKLPTPVVFEEDEYSLPSFQCLKDMVEELTEAGPR